MMLKCIAIDDEPPALDVIREYLSRFPKAQLIQTFDDAVSGAEYLRNTAVDLLFLDINMPDITGLDLARSLQAKPMIIFTTAYKKFAFEGFELDAIDYLLKPISFDRFSKALGKAIEYQEYKNKPAQTEDEYLFVYSEYRMIRIRLSDIEYIESLEDYIRIHLTGAKPILTLMTLKAVLEKLPPARFSRIHRSYVVATAKVESIQHKKVMLQSKTELPVSDSYTDFIRSWTKK
ncbi:MAG: DNA-binding response regulator [Citrobacter freundii]|nr:MAG: DNA-binding response regulator [Citrobacter freundii]